MDDDLESLKKQVAEPAEHTGSRSDKKILLGLTLCILLGAVLVGGFFGVRLIRRSAKPESPVPTSISSGVSFPIYYPDEKKLPSGYSLDQSSFSVQQKGVLYRVNKDSSIKLTFSVQAKPVDSEIQNFYTNIIPLRNHLLSSLGPVEVGAYNNKGTIQSVISIPISTDPTWVIITGPQDLAEDDIKQIVESLKK